MGKFRVGDRVIAICDDTNPPKKYFKKGDNGTIQYKGHVYWRVDFDNGKKEVLCDDNEIELIKEADMELKDDDVMQKGDIVYYQSGNTMVVDGWAGSTVRDLAGGKLPNASYLKVTRPGKKGEKKMKEKKYPKLYVQWNCPSNDDDMSLRVSSDPTDLRLEYPMLQIKDGKVTEVMVETKTVVKVKKVK